MGRWVLFTRCLGWKLCCELFWLVGLLRNVW